MKSMLTFTSLFSLLISLLIPFGLMLSASAQAPASDTWPQWRGVERTGVVKGPAWPADLEGLTEQWSVKLAEGYPGPIVSADKVFTVETKGKKDEIVRAFDRTTGEQIWEHSWAGSMKVPFFAASNGSWVRSTPAYDDGNLFVGGIQDVLVCLDADTGKPVWTVDFKKRFKAKTPAFGMVCSPLVIGDHVYVQAGGGFCKLDKKTGETVWRGLDDGGGMNGSAFSSPVLASIDGQQQLIVQTRTLLSGVDPETGKALWAKKIEAFRGMNILTPSVVDNQVFTSSYGGGSFMVDLPESKAGKIVPAFEWQNKTEAYMSSPIIIDGHAYMHLRNERMVCLDLETGETKWKSPKAVGKYMSMARQGDKILGLTERGQLMLIKASPDKMDVVSSKKISNQQTWGHIAVAGNQVFVRELKGLKVFIWEDVL